MNQMSNRRELTPDQRRAKIERDRRRRRDHNMEFERLQNAVAELQALLVSQRNENSRLKEENERLNDMMSNLKNIIHELHEQRRELQNTMKLSNEEVANNEHITRSLGSSQSAIQYADELVEDFIKKLDVKEKSNVDFSDFNGSKEELGTSWINNLPSLAPFDASIKETFGEIAADSAQSSCTAMPSRIMFGAAIKEMDNLQLDQIDERKILLRRDATNSALNINFKMEFAIIHLKKIARAYFGLKVWSERVNDPELKSIEERISKLVIEKRALEAKHAQKVEERSSEVRKQCVRDADFFVGKSLNAGLLH